VPEGPERVRIGLQLDRLSRLRLVGVAETADDRRLLPVGKLPVGGGGGEDGRGVGRGGGSGREQQDGESDRQAPRQASSLSLA
jgi:hypothetical protein